MQQAKIPRMGLRTCMPIAIRVKLDFPLENLLFYVEKVINEIDFRDIFIMYIREYRIFICKYLTEMNNAIR